MNISWDAGRYSSGFSFVHEYGSQMIDMIEQPAETVIDLGCGSGALTAELARRGFRTIGIDSSPEMLAQARQSYPDISFIEDDATRFTVREKVDAVFSNAVFHWIDKDRQCAMLSAVAAALKDGGQLVFEMGGRGNNAIIHSTLSEAFARHGYGYRMPFYFPSIREYATLLEEAGMEPVYAVLFPRMTPLNGEDGLRDWINMFLKTPLGEIRDENERTAVIEEAVDGMRSSLLAGGRWYADYVRLRMKAIRR